MREQSEKDFPDTEGKLPRTVLEYVTWQVRVQKKTTVCAQCPLRLQRYIRPFRTKYVAEATDSG